MNDHTEIKKMLSAFAGGDLAEQECRRIELHLAECPDCCSELANLRVLMRVIRSTPEVDPPPWMAARIMTSLKERQAHGRNWFHRFFFPLHIKLPIEALALLVVCVSGYYLSRNVESELRQPEMIQRSEAPLSQQKPIQEQYGSGRRNLPAEAETGRSAVPPAEPETMKTPALQIQPVVPPLPAPASPPSIQESAAPAFEEGIGKVKSEASGRSIEPRHEMKKNAKGAVRDEALSLSPSPASRAAESSSGKLDEVSIIHLNMNGRPDAAGLIRSAALRSGALILGEAESPVDQIRIRIPASRTAELTERLAGIGDVVKMPRLPQLPRELELVIKW